MVLTVISQFQVQCRDTDMFLSPSGGVISGGDTRVNIDGNFIDRQCGACVDPDTGAAGNGNNDPVTFCGGMLTLCSYCMFTLIPSLSGCVDCNEGQRRCIGNDATGLCCNWYLNDECYITCPSPLVGDTETYDCGEHNSIDFRVFNL